jgi:hypothetical protein
MEPPPPTKRYFIITYDKRGGEQALEALRDAGLAHTEEWWPGADARCYCFQSACATTVQNMRERGVPVRRDHVSPEPEPVPDDISKALLFGLAEWTRHDC